MDKSLLNQVKKICQTYGIQPTREKGQNFLVDSAVLQKIVATATLSKTDTVLEVGPGLGILTEELVKEAGKVVSVELDKKLFDFLRVQFVGVENLELINEDILKLSPENLQTLTAGYKIVANLPYNITSIFLKKFLTAKIKPTEMTLLLQKEVAQRICALPGNLSLLGLSVQLYSQPEIISVVKPNSFWPAPVIDSAVIKLSSIKDQNEVDKKLQGVSEDKFWQTAKIGFAAKRKQLHNNLAAGLRISSLEVIEILKKADFDPKIRAQNLSVEDWVRLAKHL